MDNGRDKPSLIIAILFKSKGVVGGFAQRFAVLHSALVERGYSVDLLTTESLLNHLNITNRGRVNSLDDSNGKLSATALITIANIFRLVLLKRYKHIHIGGGGRLALPLLMLAKISSTPISVTFASRTLEMASYGRARDIKRWKRILNLADRIDVLNPGHDLFQWAEKISVSPGSFPSRYKDMPTGLQIARQQIAVFCGAFEHTKNPLLAVEAFARHIERGGRGQLILFGSGTLAKSILERSALLNASAGYQAITIGHPSTYFLTLSTAAVFLSLQEFDNYPSQSLMEAMLLGCRCISTADGDTALMFPAGNDNIILDTRDPGDFATAIQELFASATASLANREHILGRHSISRFSDYFMTLIDSER